MSWVWTRWRSRPSRSWRWSAQSLIFFVYLQIVERRSSRTRFWFDWSGKENKFVKVNFNQFRIEKFETESYLGGDEAGKLKRNQNGHDIQDECAGKDERPALPIVRLIDQNERNHRADRTQAEETETYEAPEEAVHFDQIQVNTIMITEESRKLSIWDPFDLRIKASDFSGDKTKAFDEESH